MNIIKNSGIESMGRFYGTYLGFVKSIKDPLELNHLLLYVPEVMGPNGNLVWAIPKNTFGGKGYGSQVIPRVGDTVWVTYRQGHPRYPLWELGHYGKGEKPEEFKELDTYGFITPGGIKILLKDSGGSVHVEIPSGDSLSVKENRIALTNADGTLLEIDGKEIKVNGDHLTRAEELKKILETLQEHLVVWSTAIKAKVAIGLGETSPQPDVGLVQWRISLKDFLTKWS